MRGRQYCRQSEKAIAADRRSIYLNFTVESGVKSITDAIRKKSSKKICRSSRYLNMKAKVDIAIMPGKI